MRRIFVIAAVATALGFAGAGIASADDDMTHDQPAVVSTGNGGGMTHD
jgi:hypothetical protein